MDDQLLFHMHLKRGEDVKKRGKKIYLNSRPTTKTSSNKITINHHFNEILFFSLTNILFFKISHHFDHKQIISIYQLRKLNTENKEFIKRRPFAWRTILNSNKSKNQTISISMLRLSAAIGSIFTYRSWVVVTSN